MGKLILGYTTIGDLLINKKITKSDSTINGSVEIAIPDYQRPYKWNVTNAIQLLNDIIEAKNDNKEIYRVGTLILHQGKDECNNIRYNIVDGQQRTITFSLLLTVLFELSEEKDRKTIDFLEQNVYDNNHNKHNIPNVFRAFRRRLGITNSDDKKKTEQGREMCDLRDFILSQCEFIIVITDDESEAFQFFDSQNSRGKSLYPHDLLKAYHLREMRDVAEDITLKVVEEWEAIEQKQLNEFLGDYLYRIKEWSGGRRADDVFTERNIQMFKGLTRLDRSPYAQYYKSAYSYAQMVNHSAMPFVSGSKDIAAFQLDSPLIAGKPFFEYIQHYYAILKDIRDNSKYRGYYINGNTIVKTLDSYYARGTGNLITRLMFDTAVLLYVDRFCPSTRPDKVDLDLFEQYVVFAFIWAYSMRAQIAYVGFSTAQKYLFDNYIVNSFNIYRIVSESETPTLLLSNLADKLRPLPIGNLKRARWDNNDIKTFVEGDSAYEHDDNGVFKDYLYFFIKLGYIENVEYKVASNITNA